MVKSGARFIAEGSNTWLAHQSPSTFSRHTESPKRDKAVWHALGEAANAGGVPTSRWHGTLNVCNGYLRRWVRS